MRRSRRWKSGREGAGGGKVGEKEQEVEKWREKEQEVEKLARWSMRWKKGEKEQEVKKWVRRSRRWKSR